MKQVPVALAALTTVVGIAVGFPLASAIQPTKTVTKTVVKPVKIENGETPAAMAKSFGSPQGQIPAGTAPQDLSGCYGWIGKMNSQNQPTWVIYACVNPTP